MTRDRRFWIGLAVFQAGFGLAVFAVTRHYYAPGPNPAPDATAALKSLPDWDDRAFGTVPMGAGSAMPLPAASDDPAEISPRADAAFEAQQYAGAAELYGRLLAFDPNNVDVRNNLGLTLHYLGRSTDAIETLNRGLALNPAHQRSWLTLGFVYRQAGSTDQARAALTKASQTGDDAAIRQSALEMLATLP